MRKHGECGKVKSSRECGNRNVLLISAAASTSYLCRPFRTLSFIYLNPGLDGLGYEIMTFQAIF